MKRVTTTIGLAIKADNDDDQDLMRQIRWLKGQLGARSIAQVLRASVTANYNERMAARAILKSRAERRRA